MCRKLSSVMMLVRLVWVLVLGEVAGLHFVTGYQDLSQYSFATVAPFRQRFLGPLNTSWTDELTGATIEYICT